MAHFAPHFYNLFVAVMIGNEKINVFVDKAELLDEENAAICALIMEQTNFTIADIIINPTKM